MLNCSEGKNSIQTSIELLMKNILVALMFLLSINMVAQTNTMMIRISEIEIDSSYLQEYKNILQIEAKASVQKESGVVAIFPMYQKENPTQIRILEIYSNKSAYENHIKSPHFLKYKASTLKMVKSLKLIDMNSIDTETMKDIFRKFNR
jgi:quinol monooxygenase YgiN